MTHGGAPTAAAGFAEALAAAKPASIPECFTAALPPQLAADIQNMGAAATTTKSTSP